MYCFYSTNPYILVFRLLPIHTIDQYYKHLHFSLHLSPHLSISSNVTVSHEGKTIADHNTDKMWCHPSLFSLLLSTTAADIAVILRSYTAPVTASALPGRL